MKACILDLGFLECDENYMTAMSVHATASHKSPSLRWIQIPVYAVLLDTPQGKVLYDTGCHPMTMNGHVPPQQNELFPYTCAPEQDLDYQLGLAGVRPEDIRTVILSHTHYDHAGNLYRFPHAQVYLPGADFAHGLLLTHSTGDPMAHIPYVRADLEVQPKQYHLVESDQLLMPGLELISLPGHTPNLLGLVVTLSSGASMIFPSDAVNNPANYGPPAGQTAFCHDVPQYKASIEKVRRLALERHAQVMFSHDMPFFRTLRPAPFWYE